MKLFHRTGRSRWALAALAAALGIAATAVITPGVAAAHHANISATTDCSLVINWNTVSYAPGTPEGTLTNIGPNQGALRVTYDTDLSSTRVLLRTDVLDSSNNWRFGGSFTFPEGANWVWIRTSPTGVWGDGASGGMEDVVGVQRPTDCTSTPSASAAASCVDNVGTVTVTLSNAGNVSANFSVTHPITNAVSNVSVAGGGSTQVVLSNIPNGSYTIAISSGQTNLNQQVTVNCNKPAEPAVKVTQSCTETGGLVTLELSNTGGTSVTFTVGTTDYVVAAGGTQTVTLTYPVDGTYTISIFANGVDLSRTVTIACQKPAEPSASVKHSCVDGTSSVEVTLSNTGGTSVTFTVRGVPYTVGPNSSTTVTITGLPDGSNTIAISVGQLDLSQTVVIDCVHPVTVKTICAETDVNGTPVLWWYTIKNDDTVSATYTVTQGGSSKSVTVPAGSTSTQSTTSGSTVTLSIDGITLTTVALNTIDICANTVVFNKVVTGAAPSPGETYTIVVYRTVDGAPVKALEFTIKAGESKSFSLPSGLATGVSYTVSETVKGTAITSQVAPNAFTLLGQNGVTVTVTVTNGYATTSDEGSTTTTAPPTTLPAVTTTSVQSEPPTPPTPAPPTTPSRVLPRTGGSPSNTLAVAFTMLLAGAAVMLGVRRTRRV
jgi:LPXTG-motif cell wall-anchored protein